MAHERRHAGVTLADGAERDGVTAAKVSNANNRHVNLSQALQQRILVTPEEMGYPGTNPVTRSLRRRRTGAIGWLVPNSLSYAVTDPAMLPFLQGMADALQDARVGFLAVPAASEAAPDVSLVRNAMVDGLIVTFSRDDP